DGPGSVSIWLGDGTGGFPAATGTTVSGLGNAPEGIATADFNRDGIPDLIVAVSGAGKVSFLQGTGAGTFSLVGADITGLSQPRAVVVGDFNGDGWMDFAVSLYPANGVRFFLNTGTTGFAFTTTGFVTTGKLPIALAVGDFDRDGHLDVVSAS